MWNRRIKCILNGIRMMNKEGIFLVSRHIEEIQPEKIMGTTWYIKGKWWSSKEEDYLEEDSEEKICNSWKKKALQRILWWWTRGEIFYGDGWEGVGGGLVVHDGRRRKRGDWGVGWKWDRKEVFCIYTRGKELGISSLKNISLNIFWIQNSWENDNYFGVTFDP